MKATRERIALTLFRLIVAAAASLFAVWPAPEAGADNMNRNGIYQPIPDQAQPSFASHIDLFGHTGMDTSQPSAKVIMSNGCVMDWYFVSNGAPGSRTLFMRAEVASGASEYCRPSTQIMVVMLGLSAGESAAMQATDITNGGSWLFPL